MQLGADNEMHLIAMHWSSVLKEVIAAAASSLGRFVQPCLNHSKSVILQREKLLTSGKHSRQLFPGVEVAAYLPEVQTVQSLQNL